ncbi:MULTISPECIES: aminotransferase class I/II-fold pyridoxal phosphate-dependent enzyme [unclassified Paenibacillus]|uniref:aminotransferase class I/II-fold pyridoxal phosphate-dependent enzyme n=1 Tax=unclassified Paenibacillus TaxID=185978 RepID=UPI001AE555B1|nr:MULTISPECIES: aminotransferase class I/II-fold pyridoxal phosphate-dependent enzyme [unclassified Paenibacillus]MBP1153457.1 arginine/lysine/ornithine decarboxylase [Paenibacillus sp. PvP091]MBP1171160.1 arginine/lysine/ornithine decarboxylase [Paenibacillus sp. PvR098]MBP2442188.1 arginine/lysine/ornithine decarboxylase [Paenibacillus sp. PvP052]
MQLHHRAPLFEKLAAHSRRNAVSLHVPGHKSRESVYPGAWEHYGGMLNIDLTEIPGLDDLHHPEGAIKEAQELAADCFGAEETLFLVGGSTAGNLAMIMAVCRPGDLLIVQRDVHKSVIHGLTLAGARAVFITPRYDEHTGLTIGLRLQDVEDGLNRYPEAKALFVTNPSYYGLAADLSSLAKLLHSRGKLLLVDEAHGAHFGFHPALPSSALAAGADAVVQSTHKMLTAMTMGAMVHLQGERLNRRLLRKALAMLQSSSPSYPIMASLDLSRRLLAEQGMELMKQSMQTIKDIRVWISEQRRWKVWEIPDSLLSEGFRQDFFKLVLSDASDKLSGYAIKEQLELHGCYPELADPKHVLCVFTLASTVKDVKRLADALAEIDKATEGLLSSEGVFAQVESAAMEGSISEPVAFGWNQIEEEIEEVEMIPVAGSAGRKAAEMIVPYPPGIPVLYPGERITKRTAVYLERLVILGSRFHGYDVAKSGRVPVYQAGE